MFLVSSPSSSVSTSLFDTSSCFFFLFLFLFPDSTRDRGLVCAQPRVRGCRRAQCALARRAAGGGCACDQSGQPHRLWRGPERPDGFNGGLCSGHGRAAGIDLAVRPQDGQRDHGPWRRHSGSCGSGRNWKKGLFCLLTFVPSFFFLFFVAGGDYLLSAPVVVPAYVGNLQIRDGTLRASASFPPNLHLIMIGNYRCRVASLFSQENSFLPSIFLHSSSFHFFSFVLGIMLLLPLFFPDSFDFPFFFSFSSFSFWSDWSQLQPP